VRGIAGLHGLAVPVLESASTARSSSLRPWMPGVTAAGRARSRGGARPPRPPPSGCSPSSPASSGARPELRQGRRPARALHRRGAVGHGDGVRWRRSCGPATGRPLGVRATVVTASEQSWRAPSLRPTPSAWRACRSSSTRSASGAALAVLAATLVGLLPAVVARTHWRGRCPCRVRRPWEWCRPWRRWGPGGETAA